MTEIWLGESDWNQREEIFDWCERNFGLHGTGRWRFWSDYDSLQERCIRLMLEGADLTAFMLRWS